MIWYNAVLQKDATATAVPSMFDRTSALVAIALRQGQRSIQP